MDEFMVTDEITGHFILTEAALVQRCGIDLRARISEVSTVTPEAVIGNFLRTVSDMVYQYIHSFSGCNELQDRAIATIPKLRMILQRAMEYQAVYVLNVGNLYNSDKPEERAAAISELCKGVLATNLAELGGRSILYTGV